MNVSNRGTRMWVKRDNAKEDSEHGSRAPLHSISGAESEFLMTAEESGECAGRKCWCRGKMGVES